MAAGFRKTIISTIFTMFSFFRVIMFMPHGSCRYNPSCTEYTKEAFLKLPLYKAILKTIYRLIRCNPLSKGGYDPVIK